MRVIQRLRIRVVRLIIRLSCAGLRLALSFSFEGDGRGVYRGQVGKK